MKSVITLASRIRSAKSLGTRSFIGSSSSVAGAKSCELSPKLVVLGLKLCSVPDAKARGFSTGATDGAKLAEIRDALAELKNYSLRKKYLSYLDSQRRAARHVHVKPSPAVYSKEDMESILYQLLTVEVHPEKEPRKEMKGELSSARERRSLVQRIYSSDATVSAVLVNLGYDLGVMAVHFAEVAAHVAFGDPEDAAKKLEETVPELQKKVEDLTEKVSQLLEKKWIFPKLW